jgi:glycosyltransferase involved in cell wall biosynthesis
MMGRPVGVEVIGDPHAVFAQGVFSHPLRPLIQAAATGVQSRLCRNADAVMYVSEGLRQRYGSSGATFVGSDCALPDTAFVNEPRSLRSPGVLRIINVGTFAQPYKGQDLLLRSVRQLNAEVEHLKLHVDFVGAGKHQAACVALARQLGLEGHVTFHGHVANVDSLRALLDAADVMVHPSQTEGMPRVIIEAMARALPCIATRVGGIPELLDTECLVPPGDCDAIARAIESLARAPARYAAQSRRNLRASLIHSERQSMGRYAQFLQKVIYAAR